MEKTGCIYCDQGEDIEAIMLPVCDVDGYPLYFMKNQTYRGRVVLAYDQHIKKPSDMDPEKAASFFGAVYKVCCVLDRIYAPGQINTGMFADKMCHLHCHIVPKYEDGPEWGSMFLMNPEPPVLLSDADYSAQILKLAAQLAD